MQHFCGILPGVFAECFPTLPSGRVSSESDGEPAGEAEASQLGVIDQTKLWRKLARKRNRKAAVFLADAASAFLTLLWAVLTAPVMRIHFALFKQATWLSERVQPEDTDDLQADLASTAAFVKGAMNPAYTVLALLVSMVSDSRHKLWLPLVGCYGDVLTWTQDKLRTTRRCVFTIIGQMWRKLIDGWERYPWRLVELLEAYGQDEKKKIADQFLAAKECCLDSFSGKLQKLCQAKDLLTSEDAENVDAEPDVDEERESFLMSEKCESFLAAVFDRVVPTSTYVERMFARFNSWTETKGPKLRLSQLAAKHFTQTFTHLVDNWRKQGIKAGKFKKPINNKSRPAWVKGKRKNSSATGLHLFSEMFCAQESRRRLASGQVESWPQFMRRAKNVWQTLDVDDRKQWQRLARAQNLQSKAAFIAEARARVQAETAGGPWNIASSSGFPLDRRVIVKHHGARKAKVTAFRQRTNKLQPENFDSMDAWPESEYTLFAKCSRRSCVATLNDSQQTAFGELHDVLVHVIMTHAPLPSAHTEEPLVLGLASDATDVTEYFVLAYHTRKPPIDAAFAKLAVRDDVPGDGVHICLKLAKTGTGDLVLMSDKDLAHALAQQATDWAFFVLAVGRVRDLSEFDITSSYFVDPGEAKAARETERQKAAALAALRQMTNPKPKPDPKQGTGKASGSSAKKSSKDSAATVDKAKLEKLEAAALGLGHSSSSSGSEKDQAAMAFGLVTSRQENVQPSFSGAASSGASGSVLDENEVAAVPPPPDAPAERRPRTMQRRSVVWGSCPAFQLAPVYRAGQHMGFSALCHRHTDPGVDLICKKEISAVGGLPHDVCRLRLKRWLVAGLDDEDWPEKKREFHISMGNILLRDFSQGKTSEELDRIVQHVSS
ncbi:unnamed protein product [Symbiodinium sp. CCMP2592]|nr:unnamed protein product [Symbiodinium sp. CCMP2592]CAE7358968.1 unnamed protein product [Symbiodinium sp. CCMP2592]